MKRVTDFLRARQQGTPIAMTTCYDAWSAQLIAQTPVDAVLIGDSAAMVMHGHESTVHATVEMMAAHTAAVARGLTNKVIVGDMPFPTHRLGKDVATRTADTLLKAGAHAVKLEGARGHLDTVHHLVEGGVPVMGHLGLTPQSVHVFGGHKVQGRGDAAATQLIEDAKALEDAGVFAIVLEVIPAELAKEVTQALTIPTIGIGSGVHCSGQILVLQDLLGMNADFQPKFLRTYLDGATLIQDALTRYTEDVKGAQYPSREESFV